MTKQATHCSNKHWPRFGQENVMPASSAVHEAALAALVLECSRNTLDTVPYSAPVADYSVSSA